MREPGAKGYDPYADQRCPASALTERNRRIIRCLAEGHGPKEIAREMHYTGEACVNVTLHLLRVKVGVRTNEELVATAMRLGVID